MLEKEKLYKTSLNMLCLHFELKHKLTLKLVGNGNRGGQDGGKCSIPSLGPVVRIDNSESNGPLLL